MKKSIGIIFLTDPGEPRGCSTNSLVIHWFSNGLWIYLVPTALRHRHTQTVWDSSSTNKIDYVIVIKNIINPKGHQNPINGSIFTAILMKGSIGGASAVEGLRSTGLPRLVSKIIILDFLQNFEQDALMELQAYFPPNFHPESKNRRKKDISNFVPIQALNLTKFWG